jgi:hypothetical protein
MAYIRGSQIRPELGRTDYTPFLQGSLQGTQSIQRGVEQGLSTIAQGMQEGAKRKSQEKIMKGTVDATIKELDSIAAVYGQNNIVRSQVESYRTMFQDPTAPLETKFAASQQAQQGIKFLQQYGAAGVEQYVDSQALLAGMAAFNQTGDANAAANAYFGANPNGDINRLSTAMNMTLAANNAGDETTALTRKVDQMVATYPGLTRAQAMDLANGFVKVNLDPNSGETSLVNIRTGTAESVDIDASQFEDLARQVGFPNAATPNDQVLYDMAQSTGLYNAFTGWAQGIVGQVGLQVADPEVQEQIQFMNTATRRLVRALSENPRFPEGERLAIEKEVNIKPAAWTDTQSLQAQMRGVDKALRSRMKEELAKGQNRFLSPDERRGARVAAMDIYNFLQVLGVPQDGEQAGGGGRGEGTPSPPPASRGMDAPSPAAGPPTRRRGGGDGGFAQGRRPAPKGQGPLIEVPADLPEIPAEFSDMDEAEWREVWLKLPTDIRNTWKKN